MKNTILLAIVCIALGFSAGWLAKPDTKSNGGSPSDEPSKRSSTSSKTSTATAKKHQPTARPARTGATAKKVTSMDELDPETKKQIEESQKKQQKMVRDQLKKKFDLKIASMVKELGLDASQEKALRAFFDQQLDLLSSSSPMESMGDPDSMKKMAAAMRGDGLDDYMKEFLSDDQMEGLETFQKRQKKNKIEGKAMKDLSKIQQALDLTDDQRDAVYNVLVEDAEKSIDAQSDANVVMDGMMKTMGLDIDMGDMDVGSLMQMDANQKKGEKIDQVSIIAQMKEDRAKKIDAKVERMAPVLNEAQLDQYRNHLESKGGMFNMMIQGMESAGDQ